MYKGPEAGEHLGGEMESNLEQLDWRTNAARLPPEEQSPMGRAARVQAAAVVSIPLPLLAPWVWAHDLQHHVHGQVTSLSEPQFSHLQGRGAASLPGSPGLLSMRHWL